MMILNNVDGATSMNHSKVASVLGQRQLPKGNIISNELRDLVYAFWTSETRVSPNKKDICRKRVGRKSVVKHPVHLLDDSQVL